MTAAELDQFRVLLRTVDPLALTRDDQHAMVQMLLTAAIEAKGVK
jgi:hypothetical protein